MLAVSEKILAIWGGRTAWAGRKIVEFCGTHILGSISTGKCFAAAAKQLPVVKFVDISISSACIIFFQGYSTFLWGVRKYHYPPQSAPPAGWLLVMSLSPRTIRAQRPSHATVSIDVTPTIGVNH